MAVNMARSAFNEKVRTRIFCNATSYNSSSGSEHDAETDVVSSSSSPSSPSSSLSYLVQNFLEPDGPNPPAEPPARDAGSDSEPDDVLRPDPTALIERVVNPTVRGNADPFGNRLLGHVCRGAEIFSIFKRSNKSVFNRNLMAYLREIGYNAGVCKARWDSTPGGLPAGSYDFIDVIPQDFPTRYIIDADFAGEFEMARETATYAKLRSSLPRVFVGKPEDLKRIVRLMSDEARRSMKINGLTLPPWRKNRYMQAKWLGSYRRTTSHSPAPANPSKEAPGFPVKCRSVGFDLAGDGGRLLVPPATRTR